MVTFKNFVFNQFKVSYVFRLAPPFGFSQSVWDFQSVLQMVAPLRTLKPPFLEHLRPKDFSMTQFSSEHSKESPRWLRDLLSLFHNNIAQTQRLSGTLAVMAKAIGKAYFMRQRFLLYRWKDIKQFCRQRKPLSNKNDIDPDQSFELFFLTSINISFKLLVYRLRIDDFFNRISCRGMQRNGGTSRKSYRVFGAFSWVIPLTVFY